MGLQEWFIGISGKNRIDWPDSSTRLNSHNFFQQILLVSSFMSPVESRNSDPVNRVRCFGRSALVESLVESKCKWDFVKIICTQPFNKRVQYGLSFVKLHSSDAKDANDTMDATVPSIVPKVFGNFKIREESPDSDSESPTSLFSRWKLSRSISDSKEQSPSSKPLSGSLFRSFSFFDDFLINLSL